MTTYSGPNRMVWQFFEALRRSVARAHEAANQPHLHQEVAVSVFLAVTTVEAFLNLYFRLVVEEPPFSQHKKRLLDDLSRPYASLEQKLRQWPKEILGNSIDLESGPGKAFLELKDLRNRLMHFKSSHDTIEIPGGSIQGLPNTTVFDELTAADSDNALETAEALIGAVMHARGIKPEHAPRNLQFWTGKVPI